MTNPALTDEVDGAIDQSKAAGRHALVEWMASDPRPRMIIGSDLRLLWSSRSAIALGATSDLFRIEGERLLPLNKQFSDLCAHNTPDPKAWRLVMGADGRHNMIWSTRLSNHVGQFTGIVLQQRDHSCPSELANAFGLTRSEAKASGFLLYGLSTKEVAGEMGVAVDTVKTHLKHVYEKLEVRSREQFFAKASLFDPY